GEDGVIKPDVYELALEDMVAERVAAMVREKALATEADIRALLAARKEGGEAPNPEMAQEFDALPLETRPYVQIADENYELGTLVVGDMLGPIPYTDPQTGARGQELVVMMERRVPAAETFAASDETNRNQYTYLSRLQYQGSFGFTYAENGPTAIIQPSPAMLAGIADKFNRGELSVNQEWLTNTGDEG
ncbi:MAG: hypothetical protein LIP23_02820, partial [Planctomycetes bacterium]|nr:hypothetical protein [Planctomycetota bacterium]